MSSSPKPSSADKLPPAIRIHSASPQPPEQKQTPEDAQKAPSFTELAPRRTQSLPAVQRAQPNRPKHKRKRSASADLLKLPETVPRMPSGSSSRQSSGSPRTKSSSSSKKSKSSSKDLDWSDITDPEERRRIQNRIAQRKFREKARETKERTERDSRNQEYAGNSYRVASPSDFSNETEPSGLPWGSMNIGHFVTRGHEYESRRSSGRETFIGDDSNLAMSPYDPSVYAAQWAPTTSYGGSSGGEEAFQDQPDLYLYDPTAHGR